ncbi:UbiA family prenyltransferase [Bradyrhizobium sp. AUGA SZCCT0431]|uniref:UbiA family prenyltransferase n=1 Tax=Bradyrhizobium sp. AUGA SZCCT0431 TaxID=2807674 RepID=UPI001BA756E0|nr:UbiA family prenyltransferase [Bradyrhizobium sp. AUGA SZCCT0431]MBR1144239.1 UbiA family prenyltransferase [Bradyrhizobium sp. AUGA SZCCT0431]
MSTLPLPLAPELSDPCEAPQPRPLILDLDGTLVRADMLLETVLALLRAAPWRLFEIGLWMLRGRAYLKRRLADETNIEPDVLPFNEELLAYAADIAASGRPVYVATAADAKVAEKVVRRIAFIRGVIGSDGLRNLKGEAKALVLAERFPDGFDYAGDARADIPIWRRARNAIVVEAASSVEHAAASVATVAKVFPRPSRIRALVRSMRPHQWAKNALVFVPLILAGLVSHVDAVYATTCAFLALGLVASSTYLVNDIWDLTDDRSHWSKRNRPLASGRLPLATAIAAVPIGLFAGLAVAALAGPATVAVVLLYLAVTLLYSFALKRIPILDGFVLAGLFTLRLGAGIVASGAPPSPWLLVFAMFLFASLSFAKRHTEVARVIERGGTEVRGRGYKSIDLPLIMGIGMATGVAAVLIMVLYIINDAFRQSFYGNTAWLWAFPAILFLFVCRIWLKCGRSELHDDPVAFAVTDRPSLALGGALMVCFGLAWSGVFG